MADPYKHLFLSSHFTESRAFTSPTRGGGDGPAPRDRASHAQKLKQEYDQAWKEASQKAQTSTREGSYLEFTIRKGSSIEGLNNRARGKEEIKLLNASPNKDQSMRATVFIPENRNAYFSDKVTEYSTENTPKEKPKHATLIESIEQIKAAQIESSFWKDYPSLMPRREKQWLEVWISTEQEDALQEFKTLCGELGIELGDGECQFPERTVLFANANMADLTQMVDHTTGLIAEFRAARELADFFTREMKNPDQVAFCDDLLARMHYPENDDVSVLVLDSGVNNGHRLLAPLLRDEDCHSSKPEWYTTDHKGHGTQMAGIAGYGDLLPLLHSSTPEQATHVLESAKILPPPNQESNPRKNWGDTTAQGIYRAELQAPHRKRVICMAVTAKPVKEEDDVSNEYLGRPSSWSGQVDTLCSGAGDQTKRLFIVSAGNVVDEADYRAFPESNLTLTVEDPAQSWNALTVGAYTSKTQITDPDLNGYSALAKSGDLSPHSTTSILWRRSGWPIKPEVVFEGGNVAIDASGNIDHPEELQLLTTSHKVTEQFVPFNATSAASAQAAHMAAELRAEYPEAWPETIRGLIVHSAQWTQSQKQNHLEGTGNKGDYKNLTRVCGYGVPSIERARAVKQNSLSLIIESEIQPYQKTSSVSLNEMHLHRLPWPKESLLDLGETEIKMRVTLSYFIEPSPSGIGWKGRYTYPSCGLRFKLCEPTDTEDQFLKRINKKAREEDYDSSKNQRTTDPWVLGENRDTGSIHSDIWSGTAAALASSNLIAVCPVKGWWAYMSHLNKFEQKVRYALIVSFTTPNENLDIYTPIASQIQSIPVEV